uniref:Uncharacterized protein n=1 Tax=Tanacetum cinerariifolium TaxID=118510 RepID=A0A6L2LAZ7_TANCI|nr:hypothetical protein [Tanacetum cinerariifolium]
MSPPLYTLSLHLQPPFTSLSPPSQLAPQGFDKFYWRLGFARMGPKRKAWGLLQHVIGSYCRVPGIILVSCTVMEIGRGELVIIEVGSVWDSIDLYANLTQLRLLQSDVYIHQPIIILSDSNVEHAFSSTNTPDYTSASPNYSSASPRNTASDFETESDLLDDLFKDHPAPLAISSFYDDPYTKVMQAYNATSNESPIQQPRAPITPPTVLPSSIVLRPSPLFDPQDFFLPEEILPPQK